MHACAAAARRPPGLPHSRLVVECSSSVVLTRSYSSLLAVAVCHLLVQNAKGMPQQDRSVGHKRVVFACSQVLTYVTAHSRKPGVTRRKRQAQRILV